MHPFASAPETDATEIAVTQAVARIHFMGCPPVPEDQFGQAKTVPAVPSDYDAIEVGGYPAVREDTRRLGQYLVAGVAAGNVGENELLYVACGRERCRFRRSKMAVVSRHLCITIEKRRFDDQYVCVSSRQETIGPIAAVVGQKPSASSKPTAAGLPPQPPRGPAPTRSGLVSGERLNHARSGAYRRIARLDNYCHLLSRWTVRQSSPRCSPRVSRNPPQSQLFSELWADRTKPPESPSLSAKTTPRRKIRRNRTL